MASRFFKFGSLNQNRSFTKRNLNFLRIDATCLRWPHSLKRCIIVNNIDTIG